MEAFSRYFMRGLPTCKTYCIRCLQPYRNLSHSGLPTMVASVGLEPTRPFGQRIFLLLYVTIATFLCCSLDYVFTCSRWWVYSLYTFRNFFHLARRSLHLSGCNIHRISPLLLQAFPPEHSLPCFSWRKTILSKSFVSTDSTIAAAKTVQRYDILLNFANFWPKIIKKIILICKFQKFYLSLYANCGEKRTAHHKCIDKQLKNIQPCKNLHYKLPEAIINRQCR